MWDSVDDILDFAIGQEEKAAQFYKDLSGRVSQEHMSKVFLDLAAEEEGHKAKLLAIKSGKEMMSAEQKIVDLKIGDHLEGLLSPGRTVHPDDDVGEFATHTTIAAPGAASR